MSKAYFFTAGTVLAGLALGSAAAFAQEVPHSAAHQQATLNHDPDACSKAVEKDSDDIFLRMQGKEGDTTRTTKKAFLETARNAAKNGDDQRCWYWYDRVQNFSR